MLRDRSNTGTDTCSDSDKSRHQADREAGSCSDENNGFRQRSGEEIQIAANKHSQLGVQHKP